MKKQLFLFAAFIIHASIACAQKTLSFDITNDIQIIKVDNNIQEEDVIDMEMEQGKFLIFKIISNPGQDFSFTITKGDSTIEFKKNEFKNGQTLQTDKSLKLKKLSLSNSNFSVILDFNDNVIKRAISLHVAPKINPIVKPERMSGNQPIIPENSDKEVKSEIYKPGGLVYDALVLNHPEKLFVDEWDNIIKFYFPKTGKGIQHNELKEVIKQAPFLENAIDLKNLDILLKKRPDTGDTKTHSNKSNVLSASLSAVGGLDVTSIADGVARFLVKRSKEELSITFFNRLREAIDSISDLQVLFPTTANLLSAIGTEVYDYQNYIQSLREAFKKDIQILDESLPGIIDNHHLLFEQHPALETSLRSGCFLVGELKKQVHPGDILANYPLEYLDNVSRNWSGAIQTLQLLSSSIRDTTSTDSTYWVSIKYLRNLVHDNNALKIYFGLLYQKAINDFDSVHFEKGSLVNMLDSFANDYDRRFNKYRVYILRFAEKTDALNKMIKNYAKPANDSLTIELYKKYFDASVDLIEYASQVGELPSAKGKFIERLHDTLAVYFNIIHATSDLVIDINRKNYSAAINHAIYIYSTVRTKPSAAAAISLKNAKQATDSLRKTNAALHSFVRYGGFIAAVATAKSSEEVASAVEAFALPSGSSRIKRVSGFNVSLNAYPGLFLGMERIRHIDTGRAQVNSYGVTATIGVAASWGHRFLFFPSKKEWSSSIYISLVDLGAIAAFRFRDDSTANVPTIHLREIFSPGAFISLGIPRTPLSINFGVQTGPNLRKVKDGENDYSNNTYLRYSAAICVDIPVLNFYTRSR